MPSKSSNNNMSPMPMQPKIGEASLKFGPDWLRALSSSETTGGNSTSPGGGGESVTGGGGGSGGGGGPPRGFGFSGWGGTGDSARSGFSNSKDYAATASSHFSSSNYHHHQQQSYQPSGRDGVVGKGGTPPGVSSTSAASSLALRFKPSEHRYSREEMLTLYDKNLDAPSFLLNLGTLFIEKMQPPLAFSQPSEEEIRIWHSPQPESSRQGGGTGGVPAGRGFAIRGGRGGGGIERGRGRGRGGYYGRSPHDQEDERVGTGPPRPRTFERSQSNHERLPWSERNGVNVGGVGITGGGPPGVEESTRGGGSWRSRESFGGRRHDENDDGWRKPRWRRGDEEAEDGPRGSGSSRRLNRSWSEDNDNHDNIPEWARDNPSEESGTFDSSGAFHGEDRIRNSNKDLDRKHESDQNNIGKTSRVLEPEPTSGSQNDRVQKRTPDRSDSSMNKPVIPASVREEPEDALKNDSSGLDQRSENHSTSSMQQQHSVNSIKQDKMAEDGLADGARQHQMQHGLLGPIGGPLQYDSQLQQHHQEQLKLHQQQHKLTAQQQQLTNSSIDNRTIQHMSLQQQSQPSEERNLSSFHHHHHQQSRMDMRASNSIIGTNESNSSVGNVMMNRHNDEDPFRSMTEEAFNLVSKLIEEDGVGNARHVGGAGPSGQAGVIRMPGGAIPSHHQMLQAGAALPNNVAGLSLNDLSRGSSGGIGSAPGGVSANNLPASTSTVPVVIPATVNPPVVSPAPPATEVWFYRDPQGSVQGPFSTPEMNQWYSQGYFSGKLLLRRDCDKVFITLAEMGKLYGRNPFISHPDSPVPPPLNEPSTSALDFPRGDSIQIQAQLRQQQLLQQQNIIREQQQAQFMMNLGQNSIPKDDVVGSAWQGGHHNIPQASQQPQQPQPQGRHTPNAPLTPEQMQAQLLMTMAKSGGIGERDPNMVEQLHALLQRQMKNSGADPMMSQQQSNQKNDFGDMIPSNRHSANMDVSKSPTPNTNALQSIVQQLTNSMANTQHLRMNSSGTVAAPKPADAINAWGQINPAVVQPPVQNQWGSQHNNASSWEYREQVALNQQKLHEEEMRRRKEEAEEADRKRLEDEDRKRAEEQQRVERERKRMEEQRQADEEKQRKQREEQYLIHKQQQEVIKQREEAELARQKEIDRQKEIVLQRQLEQRQQLEQQRQLRDEQTRLAEEQQQQQERLEQQLLEKERLERKEKEQAERELKLRQERERQERADQQAKQQQFSWNSAPQPTVAPASSKSLLEIQQEESVKQEKEAALKKKQQQQEQLRQQQQQAQQQKNISLKWAQGAAPQVKTPIKSLTEIQAEEQAKLHKQQEKEREKRAIVQQQHNQQQAWSAQLTWANRASAVAAAAANKANGGVWDREEPTTMAAPTMAAKLKSSSSSNNQSSNNRTVQQPPANPTANPGKQRPKDIMSEDPFLKLFSVQDRQSEIGGGPSPIKGSRGGKQPIHPSPSSGPQDDFTRWCFEKVQTIGGSVDIPTFVGFLKEVESPFEVGDYVRSYLGDGKEARDFSREFLERRSKWKNSRKDGGGSLEDNLCRPASAVNPNSNDFQEVKAKGKKPKKGKMQKVDSRILGFSTSAATDRLNVGNRDYGDSTE